MKSTGSTSFAYDRARVTALKLLGLSKLDTLDKERKATRKRWAETPGSTEVPPVPDDDQPWLEPVTDIGPVLDTALAELARYVVAPQHRLATTVLWSAYAHLLPREDLGIDVAPRLGIRSRSRTPASQRCSNASRIPPPTRSSPVRSAPRRFSA